jgi:hypothetical protein
MLPEREREREREKRIRRRRRRRRSPVEIISATTWFGASRSFWDNLFEEEFSFFLFLGGRGGGWGICFQVGREETKRQSVSQSVSLDEFDEARQSLW